MNKQILKVLVGSRAHGLATKDSDYDYRGVFVTPTREILSLGAKIHTTSWIEGKDDDTSWEIGHFLDLAIHSNPTILEVFLAPEVEFETNLTEENVLNHAYGTELRALFPYIWSSVNVHAAFKGYGLNQRKKFLDEKDGRPGKYAVAYLRTLFQGTQLLNTGTFDEDISKTEVYETLKRWKEGGWTAGEVIDTCLEWEKKIDQAFAANPDKQTDKDKINQYLLKVRKENW